MIHQIIELKKNIVETEDLIEHIQKYQLSLSIPGFASLADDLRAMRIELAEMENTYHKRNNLLIKSN
jgi:hypothetical protein